MIDQPPSLAPTPPDDPQRTEGTAARRRPLWMVYVLAALLTLVTLLIRLGLGFTEGDPPLLILFIFPIVVSAYVGRLGSGLLATVLATLLSNYVLLPPQYAFSLTTRFTLLQSGGLLGAGIVISVLSEALHRARVQAETSQRLQAVTLASIGDAVITTDTHGQITFLNPEAERLTGWNSAESIGQSLAAVFRLLNAHTRAQIDDPVTKVLRSGTVVGLANHTLLISRDGREMPIDDSGAPIRYRNGAIAGVVLVFRDVTEREQADSALRESQERLAGIVGAAMDAIISIDAAQRIVVFNTAAEQMFGCPAAATIGQPLDRFVPARFRNVHAAHIQAFGQTGVTSRSMHSPGTLTALRADGTEFPIEATIAQTVVAGQPLSTVIMRDISARIQAEVALHASEQRYRQIVETAQEGIWQIDASNRTTFVNARMAAMLGYSVDEMLGASLFDFMDAEGQAIAAANVERRRHGIAEQHEFKFRRKDGIDVWALISTNPVLDGAGTYAGALAMVTDITARKRDEQALRLSESRFATAFRASPVCMSITSLLDGRYIDINTSHERLFGYARDELVGQSADGISIYADPNQRAEVVRIISAHGSLRETELTLRTRSGELREVLCSLEKIEVDGEACILGSVFDITARKRAESALRASEERFRQVFLANPAPKLITRRDNHTIVDANPAFARMTGYAHEELVGQTTDALGLWPESTFVTQTRAHLRQADAVTNRELPIRTRDGSVRELLVSVVPIDLDGVAGFLTVMLDQTERKRAEVARERAADRLRVLADASAAFAEVGATYQPLLDQVAHTTASVLGEGCTIRLLSDDAAWLPAAALYDVDPQKRELASRALAEVPLRVDEPALAAQVFHQRQPLLIAVVDPAQLRAATKPEYRSLIDGLGLRSLIFVPMRMQGRVIGVVTLYRRERERPPFDDDDVTLAQDLADRAALAIGNAQLFQQVQDELAERMRVEAALRESEELLRAVTDTAQVGLVIVDQEHRYRYANPAYATIFHLEAVDLVGRRVADVLASVYDAHIRPRLERAFDGERVHYELVVPPALPNPEERHYAVTYEPGDYRSANVVVVVVMDITERKRAEQALQRHSVRLQHLRMIDQSILVGQSLREIAHAAVIHVGHLIPSTRVALVLVDVASATISLFALQLRGELQVAPSLHAPLQIIGEALAQLTQGQIYAIPDLVTLPDLPPALRAAQVEGVRAYFYTPILAGDELIAILNIGSEQPGAFTAEHFDIAREVADQLSIAIQQARLRDAVTRHAQELEGRVAARTAELTAANKELEAFSYSVSHDLRAPLRAIDGFTRILLDEYAADFSEEAQHYFQLVRDNAQRMGELVDDLLAFSRLSRQPLAMRTVDVAQLVQQCLQELQAEQADRQLTLRIGDLPACQGDGALLKQVWFNLIANALKYTRRRDEAEIVIDYLVDGAETVFYVKDNGVGFDMRYSDKLFGVFQRLHRAEDYEGTGVGLAIVQRIVHRHGGRIWAEAAPNQGATFFFTVRGPLP